MVYLVKSPNFSPNLDDGQHLSTSSVLLLYQINSHRRASRPPSFEGIINWARDGHWAYVWGVFVFLRTKVVRFRDDWLVQQWIDSAFLVPFFEGGVLPPLNS